MHTFRRILPSRVELMIYLIITLLILVVSNIPNLINVFGTSLEQTYVNSYLKDSVTTAFSTYSNRFIGPETADFIFWVVVSLVILSFLKAAHRAYKEITFDISLSSDEFVHPGAFRQSSFWVSTAINFFLQLASLLFTAFCWYSLVFFITPIAIVFAQVYILNPTMLAHLPLALIGVVVMYIGILFSVLSVRLTFMHPSLAPHG